VPVDRPTFSRSSYRVADLCPRLRSTVQIHRQHYRGRMWHVIQDPASNQFFRVNEAAYRFVAMLDGRRTVTDVWRQCNEQLGDQAPTQVEAIQLLGQLYTSNLLQAELPPDAEGLLRRYQKRVHREVKGYLTNFLFIRIPLFDPDHFLNRWVGVFGRLFTWYGLVFWLALVGTGLYFIIGSIGDLFDQAANVLDPENLPLLYVSFALVKVMHEFGHGFACKRFGRISGTGGEIHTMGIMLLVFTPMPYVDASSAWAFRKKSHRVIVGLAGMLVEFAVAAVAAIVWTQTTPGTLHTICYNVMFIASVSSLLFNANPLLRYDGYYILSDLIEIPNLSQRSKNYLYYLVRKYVWGVKRAQNPAHTGGERAWFVFYGIASTLYRVFICVRILLFIAGKLFFVGVILAAAAVAAWVLVPLGKFLRYLGTSSELIRVRGRAVGTTLVVLAAIVVGVGVIRMPDRNRVEGVVEPYRLAVVHTEADGFIQTVLPSQSPVTPAGPLLLVATNPRMEAMRRTLEAERLGLVRRRRQALTQDLAKAQGLAKQIAAKDEQIARIREELDALKLAPPIAGVWVSPKIEQLRGVYLPRGEKIGVIASLDDVIIRATAGQEVPVNEIDRDHVEIRIKGRPGDKPIRGKILKILPVGQDQLPSAALGYAVGGSVQTRDDDRQGIRTAERFFEIRVKPDPGAELMSGQRVMIRFETPEKPLIQQWWRGLLQLLQKRFQM